MLNMQVFKYPMFIIGLVTVFLCFMIIMSTMLVLPMYLQGSLLVAAMSAGLLMLPGGIVNGIFAPLTGFMFDKIGPQRLVIPGFVIVAAVLWLMSGFEANTSKGLIVLLHCLLMIGTAMIMMPAQTNGLNQLPRHLHADGTAFMNTLQQISGAIGTAVAASILSKGTGDYLSKSSDPATVGESANAMANGTQNAFMFVMIIALAGFIISLFIRRVKVENGDGQQMPMH